MDHILKFFFHVFLDRAFKRRRIKLCRLVFPFCTLYLSLDASNLRATVSEDISHFRSLNQARSKGLVFGANLVLSILVSLVYAFLMRGGSIFLSGHFLKSPEYTALLCLVILTLPTTSIRDYVYNCRCNLREASIPTVSRLLRRFIQVSSIFILCFVFVRDKIRPRVPLTMSNVVFKRLTTTNCSLFSLGGGNFSTSSPCVLSVSGSYSRLLHLSIPLAIGHATVAFLRKVRTTSVPIYLRLTSRDTSRTLDVCKMLAKVTLPYVLFPYTLAGSIDLLLVPTITRGRTRDSSGRAFLLVGGTTKKYFSLNLLYSIFFLLAKSFLKGFLFRDALTNGFVMALT